MVERHQCQEGLLMEIPKPTEADKEFFRSVLPDDPDVDVKPMFGNLGAFVHGNMFAGLFGRAIGVRLAESDHAELAAVDGSGPFGPAERPMGGYLSLPSAWRDSPDLAAAWVSRALAFVSTMPPKKAKPNAAKPTADR
jgi:TfoX/Sxy family transcriptional regulator of competence genes